MNGLESWADPTIAVAAPEDVKPKPGDLVIVDYGAGMRDGCIAMTPRHPGDPPALLKTGRIWVTEEVAKEAAKWGWEMDPDWKPTEDGLVQIERK